MKNRQIKRGDLYYYDFGAGNGSVQGGMRPVLVLQCDKNNEHSPTTIVAAVSSVLKKQNLPSHVLLGDNCGLKKPSMALLEQIRTVNQDELTEYVGTVEDPYILRQLNTGIRKTFGIWAYKPEVEIKILCRACEERLQQNPYLLVRRLDPFEKDKQPCECCQGTGYRYLVMRKNMEKKAEVSK